MKQKFLQLSGDVLFKNSFFLLAATGSMAFFGFFFWLIVAHSYTPEQVGLASTLISAMGFISYLALLGFNSTFIRYLPKSKRRNDYINTGLILVMFAAMLISALYIFLVPQLAPQLSALRSNPLYAVSFLVLAAMAALNLLTDSIFIAYRSAKYNFFVNGIIMSIVKLLLPLVFLSLGAYGIFLAAGSAASVAFIVSIFFLIKKFAYRPKVSIDKTVLKNIWHFSTASYSANLLNILPTMVLPIIIIDKLGPSAAGFYYLAFMVANLLYAVCYSVAQSFFAEGSYAEVALGRLVKRSSAILAAIMLPGAIALAVLGPWLLQIFGSSYGVNGAGAIVVLALSAPFVAVYVLCCMLLRISKQNISLVIINVIYAATIIGLAIWLTPHGLVWVAVAWMAGQITAGLTAVILLARHHSRALKQLSQKNILPATKN